MQADFTSSKIDGSTSGLPMITARRTVRLFIMRVGTVAVGLALASCSGGSLNEHLSTLKVPGNDPSFRTRVYGGAAVGSSNLKPDTSETVFTIEDESDSASSLRIGVDVHNLFAFELESAVLGAAKLREANTDVSYSAVSLNALVYGLNGVQMRSRREGWSAYGRFGFAQISKSSQVLTLDQGGTSPVMGVGVEYGFGGGLGVRGEFTRYSEEAQQFGFGAVYRFGRSPREIGQLIADTARPVLVTEETRVVDRSRKDAPSGRFGTEGEGEDDVAYLAATAARVAGDRAQPAATTYQMSAANDRDRDNVRDDLDRCLGTNPGVTVDKYGCGLFDVVLGDVTFKPGSSRLSARARGALDLVAAKLVAFPEVRVEVRAHTDSQGVADANLALSARRAEEVVKYLRSQEIGELQLIGAGMGEAQPIASNDSPVGRKANRRVELVTLASIDQGVLDGTRTLSRVWRYPVVREAEDVLREIEDGVLDVVPDTTTPRMSRAHVADLPVEVAVAPNTVAPSAEQDDEPVMGAAVASAARTGLPPLEGLKPAALPAPAYVSGFDMSGVVDGLGFVQGSDQMTDTGPEAIDRIRVAMEQNPSARIMVIAHTDNVGDSDDNQLLSQQRAKRVVDALVDAGVDRYRLEPEGYGETLPLVQNVTDADRARNRRVEIRLMR